MSGHPQRSSPLLAPLKATSGGVASGTVPNPPLNPPPLVPSNPLSPHLTSLQPPVYKTVRCVLKPKSYEAPVLGEREQTKRRLVLEWLDRLCDGRWRDHETNEDGGISNDRSKEDKEKEPVKLSYANKLMGGSHPPLSKAPDPLKPAGRRCCRVVAFGSWALGVGAHSSDLDVVCVKGGGEHLDRRVFFDEVIKMIEDDQAMEVTDVLPLLEAFTPVLKFKAGGVSVDLVYAELKGRLPEGLPLVVPVEDVPHDDPVAVRALNGHIATAAIPPLTPAPMEVYREAVVMVKSWAKTRGLYSNQMGFLGGVNIALLMTFASQLYPEETSAGLVYRFFQVLSTHPISSPIMICPPPAQYHPSSWSIANPRDAAALTPLLSPTIPTMNTMYNQSPSQRRRLLLEATRARAIVRDILNLNAPWSSLLDPPTFFSDFAHYLKVTVTGGGGIRRWGGFVESRFRVLVAGVEGIDGIEAWPWGGFFRGKGWVEGYVGIRFSKSFRGRQLDLGRCAEEFLASVRAWEGREEGCDVKVEVISNPNSKVQLGRKHQRGNNGRGKKAAGGNQGQGRRDHANSNNRRGQNQNRGRAGISANEENNNPKLESENRRKAQGTVDLGEPSILSPTKRSRR